jgi:segregation and condensation protein A
MPDPEPPQDGAEHLALSLDGFEGPLDLLLDLARTQKLDLARISILALVDQYLAVIEGARRIRLELAADWLVMAAWLAWLKSRLLLPQQSPAEEADQPADLLALRLQALASIRRGAAWLAERPQLGRDVFARGLPEDFRAIDRSRLAADLPALLRAWLAAHNRVALNRAYTPAPVTVWTVQDALERLRRLVGATPGWSTLADFLPPLPAATPLDRRAAYAATLLASLELARTGVVALRQAQAFDDIHIGPGGVTMAEGQG